MGRPSRVAADQVQARATVGRRSYAPHDPLAGMTFTANAARALRSSTPAKLYVYETVLERLPQDLQDMAAELRQFIQEEHTVVGQRHVAWHRHVAPAD
jgi:hypothetical protein